MYCKTSVIESAHVFLGLPFLTWKGSFGSRLWASIWWLSFVALGKATCGPNHPIQTVVESQFHTCPGVGRSRNCVDQFQVGSWCACQRDIFSNCRMNVFKIARQFFFGLPTYRAFVNYKSKPSWNNIFKFESKSEWVAKSSLLVNPHKTTVANKDK